DDSGRLSSMGVAAKAAPEASSASRTALRSGDMAWISIIVKGGGGMRSTGAHGRTGQRQLRQSQALFVGAAELCQQIGGTRVLAQRGADLGGAEVELGQRRRQ